jgi:hypothetical protein
LYYLKDFQDISDKHPFADLKPSGKYLMEDCTKLEGSCGNEIFIERRIVACLTVTGKH